MQGVLVKPLFTRGSHVFEAPILLSQEPRDVRALLAAALLPPLVTAGLRYLVLQPIRRRQKYQQARPTAGRCPSIVGTALASCAQSASRPRWQPCGPAGDPAWRQRRVWGSAAASCPLWHAGHEAAAGHEPGHPTGCPVRRGGGGAAGAGCPAQDCSGGPAGAALARTTGAGTMGWLWAHLCLRTGSTCAHRPVHIGRTCGQVQRAGGAAARSHTGCRAGRPRGRQRPLRQPGRCHAGGAVSLLSARGCCSARQRLPAGHAGLRRTACTASAARQAQLGSCVVQPGHAWPGR